MARLDLAVINVIAVSTTCWRKDCIPAGMSSEVIEVAVAEVDLRDFVVKTYPGMLVRPTRSEVEEYCQRLTGITPLEAFRGELFATVRDRLEEEHSSKRRAWASYGVRAREIIFTECNRRSLRSPFGDHFWNVKDLAGTALGIYDELPLLDAIQYLGTPRVGNRNRAADAAPMVARVLALLLQRLRYSGECYALPAETWSSTILESPSAVGV